MRKNSFSTNALRNVLEIISAKYKTEARLLNLLDTELPIYRPRNRSENENVIKVTRDVNWANVFVLASPDYHGSMSGTMKNFLDFFWKEFSGKTFGYIGCLRWFNLLAIYEGQEFIRTQYLCTLLPLVNELREWDRFKIFMLSYEKD